MIKHGEAPFIECSTRGDKRFSAFTARLSTFGSRHGKSIETLYQAFKKFTVSYIDVNGKPATDIVSGLT